MDALFPTAVPQAWTQGKVTSTKEFTSKKKIKVTTKAAAALC